MGLSAQKKIDAGADFSILYTMPVGVRREMRPKVWSLCGIFIVKTQENMT